MKYISLVYDPTQSQKRFYVNPFIVEHYYYYGRFHCKRGFFEFVR